MDAWLADNPWDARTTNPMIGFISGFAGYVAKDKLNTQAKNRRMTQEQIDRTKRVALVRKLLLWCEGDLNAQELAEVEGLKAAKNDEATWTDDELDRVLLIFRTARGRTEQEKKSIEQEQEGGVHDLFKS